MSVGKHCLCHAVVGVAVVTGINAPLLISSPTLVLSSFATIRFTCTFFYCAVQEVMPQFTSPALLEEDLMAMDINTEAERNRACETQSHVQD